tara:strand:+ start:366 stop:611 length:246 start_codon:yes stop_codon:yes gene_type:complete
MARILFRIEGIKIETETVNENNNPMADMKICGYIVAMKAGVFCTRRDLFVFDTDLQHSKYVIESNQFRVESNGNVSTGCGY